ncbi:MAG: MarR family transcriptional regulator [Rhizobiaceae bacterium]|nr:MAG: MarR family transcriptional regulator [Rhizobiaceae bacterium]
MMDRIPIGLELNLTSRTVRRAFDSALLAAGGSLPVWLILLSLKRGNVDNQRELAEAIGIRGATLTHHLNGLETQGVLTRRRDPRNRRVHIVELTQAGEAFFARLREAAMVFDMRLKVGFSDDELSLLARGLNQLRLNVAGNTKEAGKKPPLLPDD